MTKIPNNVTEYFRAMGKKGGPAAAKVRWNGVGKKKRSAAMKALVALRWAKAKAAKEIA